MNCQNCGSDSPDDSPFCAHCREAPHLSKENERGKGQRHVTTQGSYPTTKRSGHRPKPGIMPVLAGLCLLLTASAAFTLLRTRGEPVRPEQEGGEAFTSVQLTARTPSVSMSAEPLKGLVWIDIPAQPAPFYGIWCDASKEQAIAEKNRRRFAEAGLDSQLFVTTDWSNLNPEKYYVVTVGTYSSYREAAAMLPTVKNVVKNAYIKYSGDWQGAVCPELPLSASPYTGCLGAYTRRYFNNAYATSELMEGNICFSALYAIDEGSKRPWVEGVSGSGIGESLTLCFQSETTVSLIDLRLGYARDAKRYYGNNRPSLLRFDFSDGSSVECEFQDGRTHQAILLSRPVSTSNIQITILDVYCGTDDDTCIYLVKAYG